MQNEKQMTQSGNRGFTLIELLVVMAVSGIIMAAVYKIYVANQRAYTAQLAITEMQQNMRVVVNLLSSDIRMAGYQASSAAGAGIVSANPDLFSFTADINENGTVSDAGDHVAYDNYISSGIPVLGRITSAGAISVSNIVGDHWEIIAPAHMPAAENVEHLRFRYLKSLDPAPNGTIAASASEIHFVQVNVVVRTGQTDTDYLNTQTYQYVDDAGVTQSFLPAPKNDNYRRRQQVFTVECRNVNY